MIAANIANADTPGYRASDIKPFSESFRFERESTRTVDGLKATRQAHHGQMLEASGNRLTIEQFDRPSGTSPNDNTVSLEVEMVQAVEAQRAHNRAVTVYQNALDIMRSSLRAGR